MSSRYKYNLEDMISLKTTHFKFNIGKEAGDKRRSLCPTSIIIKSSQFASKTRIAKVEQKEIQNLKKLSKP